MANYFAFFDESGVLDGANTDQPYFGVGMLRIEETHKLTESLMKTHYDYFSFQKQKRDELKRDLRENSRSLTIQDFNLLMTSTRHHEFKFTNITPTTLDKYKSFIDLALVNGIHFCALVIDKTDPLFNNQLYKNYWEAYITYTKLLCKNNCPNADSLCVIADYMNRPTESELFFEQEINMLTNVYNTLRAHSETFIFIQLCDLLLGSVLFQWKQSNGYIKNSNRARSKAEFVEHITSKFEIPAHKQSIFPLSQKITLQSPFYLSVWPLKLSKF